MTGSEESSVMISTAEQYWWEAGWDGAFLPCSLLHPLWSSPSTAWLPSHLPSYNRFMTWELLKQKDAEKFQDVTLWCPCCPPDRKTHQRDCLLWRMDIPNCGSGWTPPDSEPDLVVRGGFIPLLTWHLGSWHRSQSHWLSPEMGWWWLAFRLTLCRSQSINPAWSTLHHTTDPPNHTESSTQSPLKWSRNVSI